jgi:hypothetical protein
MPVARGDKPAKTTLMPEAERSDTREPKVRAPVASIWVTCLQAAESGQ